jgi:transcriptional regulator with XRE-family HTH domain
MFVRTEGSMPTRKKPQWAAKIEDLLGKLELSQAGLADRLSVSPMTVSRWVRGTHRPTAETFLKLAGLSGSPDNLYFWEQAGLTGANSPLQILNSSAINTSVAAKLTAFKLVAGRRISSTSLESLPDGVAIPLLDRYVHANSEGVLGDATTGLGNAKVEHILTAPLDWCKNPHQMVGLKLRGNSMSPLIEEGSVIIVDTSSKDPLHLDRKVVVASHRDHGLRVAWLNRVGSTEVLISENNQYPPADMAGKNPWAILGEVIWWITMPPKR